MATRFLREKIQSSADRYPASSSSERSRGLALPITRGRSRFGNAFDSIRRFHALDDGLFPQDFENFWFLFDPEILLSPRFHATGEKPTGAERDRHLGQFIGIES